MAEERRRNTDERIDNIEQMLTKIHTVLIGNGVPGLYTRHDDLCKKVEKNNDLIKRIIYGGGGLMITLTLLLNIKNIIGWFS